MRKKIILKCAKRIIAPLVAVALLATGVVVTQTPAKAAESETATVTYVDRTSEFVSKWSAEDNEAIAPVMQGYVFGGWYIKDENSEDANEDGYVALREDKASQKKSENPTEGVFAKFVPDYVLSVKAQNEEGTKANDDVLAIEGVEADYTSMRVISAVDSKEYQKVGFEVWLAKDKIQLLEKDNQPLETQKVYDYIQVGSDSTDKRSAAQIFGAEAAHLSVWRIDDIVDANDQKIINVTPYWVTLDGTTVKGLTKFIHVEDGYMNYVSVPVNLITGQAIAAGSLEITCSDDRFEFHDVEEGVVFNEMSNNPTTKSVKVVGNLEKVTDNANATGIFANVRFKLTSGTYEGGKGEFLNFTVSGARFANWDEDFVDIIQTWKIQY